MSGGQIAAPDPRDVTSAEEFVQRLNQLRLWAGQPSLRQLKTLGGMVMLPDGDVVDALPPTTTSMLLKGTRLPRLEFVEPFVTACHAARGLAHDTATEIERWRLAWRQVANRRPARHAGRNDLPADVSDFTGRAAELARLLDSNTAVAIGGVAGVGKTTLAVHAAHLLADRYPDARLFIDLQGHSTPVDPMAALDSLLRALGVPGDSIPRDLASRSALWRAELAACSALVVLDNAVDAAQVWPLLPGTTSSRTLITSRRRMAELDVVPFLPLHALPRAESITLLTRVLRDDRVLDDDTLDEVAGRCEDLPLALRLAAAHLRTHALRPATGNRGVAAAFAMSYRDLTDEQRAMFDVLGQLPGPDFDSHSAAALAGLDHETTERLLADLVDRHLLMAPGRYRFHDLIRPRETNDAAALSRLLAYYMHTAVAAARLLDPHAEQVGIDTTTARRLDTAAEAQAWLDTEYENLLAIHRLAADRDWYVAMWQLAWVLTTVLYRRGGLQEDREVCQTALVAAEKDGDAAAVSRAHRYLGRASARLDLLDEAVEHLRQALAMAEQYGDVADQAHANHQLAKAWEKRGEYRPALDHATRALRGYLRLDQPVWQARALNLVGWCHARLAHYAEGHAHCEQALELFRRHGYRQGEAATLDSLGYIAHQTGHLTEAVDYFRQALTRYQDNGCRADTLDRLAQAHHGLGQLAQAWDAWRQALTPYRAQRRDADVDRVLDHLSLLDAR